LQNIVILNEINGDGDQHHHHHHRRRRRLLFFIHVYATKVAQHKADIKKKKQTKTNRKKHNKQRKFDWFG